MGGGIEAQSTPGSGSTFSFTLPLARAEAEPQAADAGSGEEGVCLDGLRVLLAEDHPTNRKVIQLILDSVGGVDLVMVENGRLALDALAHDSFHVVLMDMQMPELDGLSATTELRRREAERGGRRTPVIMLTANALDEHVGASLAAGADRHLSKPVRAAELIETITVLVLGAMAETDAAVEQVA
jgi:CheY-like chemotaxis protein